MKPTYEQLEKEVKFWKERYEFKQASWNALRNAHNRLIREDNEPEIRLAKAVAADRKLSTGKKV